MRRRTLEKPINEFCIADHKMAFVSGPRQCGKTTLGRLLQRGRESTAYYNWDSVEFRRQWVREPASTIPATKAIPLVVFDEIHKARGWKRTLKGIFDTRVEPVDIFVTGSARLNVYRRGGDSLVGRYYHFRLHPFSVGELLRTDASNPDEVLVRLREGGGSGRSEAGGVLEAMVRYGAFPEPFLAQDERKARLWRQSRVERVIREDLRDLSRIPDLSRIEMLAALLPERVASPLSVNALREDLEVAHATVSSWLAFLKELYYVFDVRPYHRMVTRSLKKEAKYYLWDFSEVRNEGARIENLVACHLLKACHFWSDTGYGSFDLFSLRDKQHHEIDFLVTRDGAPWLPVEVKLSDATPSPSWKTFLHQIKCPFGLQMVRKPGVRRLYAIDSAEVLVVSAAEALRVLP